ncbi:asparagine synthase (glutamine-hydrolyzing), partial [Xanthovirga aplysinae]|uniref:asparagine synthase (glutamine-hydrolyzing) n=1 Tax=Xanthovirga aplysinae TaxID=2529853 RepID=UPI0012BC1818
MCGITGVINISNFSQISQDTIRLMTDVISHRGPDGKGTYIDENVAFGHRRLSIIDLSEAGKQPMFDVEGNYGIVFNGEVYNFQEIKENLQSKGYKFQSNTDTEVILNAYKEFGIDCVHQFIGMFAFAIYERKTGKVTIVRDRLGIKPLYYTRHAGKVIFGSEIKSILQFPGLSVTYNYNGISSYLSYRYPIGNQTLFDDIFSLKPGYYLEIQEGKVNEKQYYELPIIREEDKEDKGQDYYISRIKELLNSAVNYRMISDVPVGAYLSGGLDSSIVVALMAKNSKMPIKTFTIGFEEEGFNEFEYARMVSEMYKTEHHEFKLTASDYMKTMHQLIKFKDAPLGVANEPALHIMSRELRKYITVVLSGEGSDEIFGGYGRIFRSPLDHERLKLLEENKELSNESLYNEIKANMTSKYGDLKFSSEMDHFLHLYQYVKWEDKKEFLSKDFIEALDGDRYSNEVFEQEFEKLDGLNSYDKYMWIFEKLHIVGLLQRVDMTTMATSVEARVPFVDHRLVEFALSIPVKYKLKWKSMLHEIIGSKYNSDQISEVYDDPKFILKKAFEDELPYDVVWRKKMGFPVPVH